MSPEALTSELRRLGLTPGDVVLVHTSMKGLGHVVGGPNAVIGALLEAVGPEGTVLFPTLTGSKEDGPDRPPVIDLLTTPCARFVGIVPEAARQYPGAVRSIHPTHSVVALGANRELWTSGHQRGVSPCDEASPYYRLMERGGKILLLGGVTHNSNTSMHCIEEIADVPYHLHAEFSDGRVTMPDGSDVTVRNRLHLWADLYSGLKLERDFTAAIDPLIAANAQRSRRIGQSESTLIDARAMRDVLVSILQRDPLFLLQPPA
jgi:aminoglycoside 3-N-acetyltransferase